MGGDVEDLVQIHAVAWVSHLLNQQAYAHTLAMEMSQSRSAR